MHRVLWELRELTLPVIYRLGPPRRAELAEPQGRNNLVLLGNIGHTPIHKPRDPNSPLVHTEPCYGRSGLDIQLRPQHLQRRGRRVNEHALPLRLWSDARGQAPLPQMQFLLLAFRECHNRLPGHSYR